MSQERDNRAIEFISDIDRLRWDNYRRDFRNDERDLIKLFWTLVLRHSIDLREMEADRRYQIIGDRIYSSFLGCFFRPQEIIAKIMVNWQGFSKLDIDSHRKNWFNYKREQHNTANSHVAELLGLINSILDSTRFLTLLDQPIEYDLSRWDNAHTYLNQPVSKCLKSFILKSDIKELFPNSILIEFELNEIVIDELHRIGELYTRARFNRWMLQYVESRLLANYNRMGLPKFDNISEAIDYLRQHNPDLTYQNRENVIYLMDLYCRDRKGEKFKRDSINRFIKRKKTT